MKIKTFCLILLISTSLVNLIADKYVEYYFKIPYSNQKEIKILNEFASVDKFDKSYIYAYANDKQMSQIRHKYPKLKLLPHPSTDFTEQLATTISEVREWDSYPNYSTYVNLMNQFANEHPNICSVESIGNSVDNREILVAKISDNVNIDESEPKIFYSGQIHGDEIVCYILFLRLIDHLLLNYGLDDEITQIVDNSQIYINPLSNPDGLYTNDDNTIQGATRFNANGVDLNRNFPSIAGQDHPDGNSWQMETLALMDFAEEHNFVISANSHSGEVVVNYPWDTWGRRHADDAWFQEISHGYADLVQTNAPENYMTDFDDGITNGYDWYSIHGGKQDWFTYFNHSREITLELSFQKMLPANQLNNHWNYNYQSLINLLKEVNYGIQGIITNGNSEPIEAKIEVLNHDIDNSYVYSNPEFGDYYRPIEAGEYNLKITSEGYESKIIENVLVQNNQLCELNIVLDSAYLTSLDGYIYDNNNEPVNEARVKLINSSEFTTFSDPSGYFSFTEVYSGQSELSVTASGYQMYYALVDLGEDNETYQIILDESDAISFEEELDETWFSTTLVPWSRSNDFSYDGDYSLKSGVIGNNQTSAVSLVSETTESLISFYYKVSSEASYDFLNFYINDVLVDSWSGEIDWTYTEYHVPAEVNIFTWEYSKDEYVSDNNDCAWIDLLSIPYQTTNENNESIIEASIDINCYPNPFNPDVNIRFNQSKNNPIKNIAIYNIKGQKVRDIDFIKGKEGHQTQVWNGNDNNQMTVSSGIYFVVIKSKSETKSHKILLIK